LGGQVCPGVVCRPAQTDGRGGTFSPTKGLAGKKKKRGAPLWGIPKFCFFFVWRGSGGRFLKTFWAPGAQPHGAWFFDLKTPVFNFFFGPWKRRGALVFPQRGLPPGRAGNSSKKIFFRGPQPGCFFFFLGKMGFLKGGPRGGGQSLGQQFVGAY